LLAPTLKRLSMFVLRAQCKLSDATADFALYGLTGQAAQHHAGAAAAPWTLSQQGDAHVLALYPAAGNQRALWIGPAGQAPEGQLLSEDLWQWSEVQSGVATLSAPVVDAFVPQMLNYESLGGVNFKKGCYPGPGLYVDNEIGAATATGHGEEVIRIAGCHLVVELMRQGKSPQKACEEAVGRIIKLTKYRNKDLNDIQVGFIALNKKGEHGAYCIQKGFNYAKCDETGNNLLDANYFLK
ncbi:MAG: hypothetical protein E2604_09945, partial [Flavobacterium sp.]|nr:hypothetical protein [Flavobacterium sp.]